MARFASAWCPGGLGKTKALGTFRMTFACFVFEIAFVPDDSGIIHENIFLPNLLLLL